LYQVACSSEGHCGWRNWYVYVVYLLLRVYFLLFCVSFFLHSKIKFEGPNCLYIFFFFYFCFCMLLLLLLLTLSFMLIIIYLCFFFSYFLFVLIGLRFGVIPSSNINDSLDSTIGFSGGANFGFCDINSWFMCNGKTSGCFLKG
jgi:hypothetical protein